MALLGIEEEAGRSGVVEARSSYERLFEHMGVIDASKKCEGRMTGDEPKGAQLFSEMTLQAVLLECVGRGRVFLVEYTMEPV